MGPLDTLRDLYDQIAQIKEFICEQPPSEKKNTILSLPIFDLTGLQGNIVLDKPDLFATRVELALGAFFYSHSIRDTHGQFTKLANEVLNAFNNFCGAELPENSIHLILSSLLQLIASIPTSFEEWNFLDQGEAYGSREIDLPKEIEYVGIDLVEYPPWLVRQFYYIPFVEEMGISSSVKGFFYSSLFEGFLDYSIQILSSKTVLTKPRDATKFYLYTVPQVKSRIKLWRRYSYE